MNLYLIGIDYKSASIDVRGQMSRQQKKIADWLGRHQGSGAILVTCNRMEIYGTSKSPDGAFDDVAAFFKEFPDFASRAHSFTTRDQVFRHALRVACGLESQIKGEVQILNQLKTWINSPRMPFEVREMWNEVLRSAEKIRRAAGLDAAGYDLAQAVWDDIKGRPPLNKRYEVVVIGTGKIAELFAQSRPVGAHISFVAHKNYGKARFLARISAGIVSTLVGLPELLVDADALVSATASPHVIVHTDQVKDRAGSVLHIYDLAVPRDVDPGLGKRGDVCLLNLDNMGAFFKRYNASLEDRLALAEGLTEQELGDKVRHSYA